MEQSKIHILMDFVGVYAYHRSLENGGPALFLKEDETVESEKKKVENHLDKHIDNIVNTFGIEVGTYEYEELFNLVDVFTSTEDDSVDEFIDKVERLVG